MIFWLLIIFLLFNLFFLKKIYQLAIELRCQRKVQVINDNFRTTMADAALKIEPIEEKNNAILFAELYKKCLAEN